MSLTRPTAFEGSKNLQKRMKMDRTKRAYIQSVIYQFLMRHIIQLQLNQMERDIYICTSMFTHKTMQRIRTILHKNNCNVK